ncbi:hypothetical protein ACLQ3C_21050, partial [Gordonia sp. DT30]
NKLPDVGPDFTAGLAKVRAEIHRQPPDAGNPLPDSSTGTFTDPITADRSCLVGLAPGDKILRTTIGTPTGSYDIVEIITHDDTYEDTDTVVATDQSPIEAHLAHLLATRGL